MTGRWLAFVLAGGTAVFGASPSITRVIPAALEPGRTNHIRIQGAHLGQTAALWFNIPASATILESKDDAVEAAVWLERAVPIGVVGVRIFASNGVSNVRLLMADDLPTVSEAETNSTRDAAQLVPAACAVEGVARALGFNWFLFPAAAQQRVSIEVVAARLGARLDSVLRVLDARGKEMAQNDDHPGLRADSALSFVAPEAGDYFVELRDVNYGGGGEFRFRLRIGDFSLARAAFPAAVKQGTRSKLELVGTMETPGNASATIDAESESGSQPVSVKGRAGSGFARVLVAEEEQHQEGKEGDAGEAVPRIQWPAGLNGRFDSPTDTDRFEFVAGRETRLEFHARTRSIGSPAYARLSIESPDGKLLTSSNPGDADEGYLAHLFAPGTYCLVVRDTAGIFGASAIYHVEVQESSGFSLSLEAERVEAVPGGTFELKVNCERRTFKGPIALSLAGISGLQATNTVISPGKTNVTLSVRVPEDCEATLPRYFEVWGSRDGAEEGPRVRASTRAAWRKVYPQMLDIPVEFEGFVALGVRVPE